MFIGVKGLAGGVAELDEAAIMSNVTCVSGGFCCRGSSLMSSSKTSLNMFEMSTISC